MKHLIALLLITNISFSQEWSKTKINDFASIEFPSTPERSESNGEIYYSTSDDSGVYLAMLRDLGNQRISESEYPKLYQGFMDGALKSVNGELIEQNDFHSNGLIGKEMVYLANSNPQLPDLRYKRILIANNSLISYEFWTFKETEQLASTNKDKFFNSIAISNKNRIEPEKNESNTAYESGFVFGKIIFYLLIIGLIIGGILLIRKFNRKKNQNVG